MEENGENESASANVLLEELTALKLKLEKLMERDFREDQAKMRREVFLTKLSKNRKHNLDNANKMKEEAVQLCEKWRQHRASDPTGLDQGISHIQASEVHSDSYIPQLEAILHSNGEDSTQTQMRDQDYLYELKEASALMNDVHAKYEKEEQWLRQRMEQLQKEADEIEQFKARLEKGRLLWELSLHNEIAPDQIMSRSTGDYGFFDDSYNQTSQDEEKLRGALDDEIIENPSFLETDDQNPNIVWARFFSSMANDQTGTVRDPKFPDQNESDFFDQSQPKKLYSIDNPTTPELFYQNKSIASSNSDTIKISYQPENKNQHFSQENFISSQGKEKKFSAQTQTHDFAGSSSVRKFAQGQSEKYDQKSREEKFNKPKLISNQSIQAHARQSVQDPAIQSDQSRSFPIQTQSLQCDQTKSLPIHPAMRAVDQMPSVAEQLDEWNEENIRNQSIPFIDSERGTDLSEEVVLNISLIAAEIDFFCDCNLRESVVPMLQMDSQYSGIDARPSKIVEVENEFLWTLTTSRQTSERGTPSSSSSRRHSNVQEKNLNLSDRDTDRPKGLASEAAENKKEMENKKQKNSGTVFQRDVEELNGGPLISSQITEKEDALTRWKLKLAELKNKREKENKLAMMEREMLMAKSADDEKLATASRSTSMETIGTMNTNGSSTVQKQKRTLAETVQATQQLRKQLSAIVSTYDKEVTYLLLSVENYREQWKKEHLETQKQLHELRKNMKRLESRGVHRTSSGSDVLEPPKSSSTDKRKSHSRETSKLKKYNPDLELPVGKEKLSELNRQLIELHMKLGNEETTDYDKETVRGMVNEILKQMLDLRSDAMNNRFVVADTADNGQSISDRQSTSTVASSLTLVDRPLSQNSTIHNDHVKSEAYHNNQHINSDIDHIDQSKESIQISVNQPIVKQSQESRATIVAPRREAERRSLRRSRSIEDLTDSRKFIASEEKSQEHESRREKTSKLAAEKNVISVSCEKKRSRSFEASNGRTMSRASDEMSIHEWHTSNLPRYVNDGDKNDPSQNNPEHEPKVQLSSKPFEEARKTGWLLSPVPESIDSGIGLHSDTDNNGKQIAKNNLFTAEPDSKPDVAASPQLLGCDSDFSDCQIHLHRYSTNGPAEFCRRSSRKKEMASTPSLSEKSRTFSMKSRTPSPSRLKKPIEMTNVGDAVLAIGIELMAVVMSPSKRWSDVARSVSDTSFTDKFKRAINYHKKVQSRSRSGSTVRNEASSKNALLPPKYGRRTVSEKNVERPPLANLDNDDFDEDPSVATIAGTKSTGKAKDHAAHRTRSEADVFSVKKKHGLKWNDASRWPK